MWHKVMFLEDLTQKFGACTDFPCVSRIRIFRACIRQDIACGHNPPPLIYAILNLHLGGVDRVTQNYV